MVCGATWWNALDFGSVSSVSCIGKEVCFSNLYLNENLKQARQWFGLKGDVPVGSGDSDSLSWH